MANLLKQVKNYDYITSSKKWIKKSVQLFKYGNIKEANRQINFELQQIKKRGLVLGYRPMHTEIDLPIQYLFEAGDIGGHAAG